MWLPPATSLTVLRTLHWQGEVFELDDPLGKCVPVGVSAERGRLSLLGSIFGRPLRFHLWPRHVLGHPLAELGHVLFLYSATFDL